MASAEQVVQVIKPLPLAATAAYPGILTGAATPAEIVDTWEFIDASDSYLDFLCRLIGYDGGGLTWHFGHASAVATGTTRIGVAVRAIPDDTEDLDTTAHSYDFNTAGVTVPSAIGEVAYDTITMTDGADMDSWAEGALAIVRVFRDGDGTSGTDDATGNWRLLDFWGTET